MGGPDDLPLDLDPRLVEEAVLRAIPGGKEEAEFRAGRDGLYEIADPEEREAGFREFHTTWFERLQLDRPFRLALQEQPVVLRSGRTCLIALARGSREEGADLFVPRENPGAGAIVIRLSPERFRDGERLLCFLRRELLHVADMLEPRFGYTPRFPEEGAAHQQLLRDRYRVLWDAFVDGRLLRLGRVPAEVRAQRLADFARAFPALGEKAEGAFRRFFDGEGLTHAELVSFAINHGECCPLCGLPTQAFEPEPDRLSPTVLAEIRASAPGWGPRDGCCRQCADLYRSRSA